MMNHNQPKQRISVKKLLLSLLVAFVIFFLIQALIAYVLLQVTKFERFYEVTALISVLIISLFFALFSRVERMFSISQSLLSSVLFSILIFCIGLIGSGDEFNLFSVLIRIGILICSNFLFSLLFIMTKEKRRKERKASFPKFRG